jgi:predicted GNAT family N-acyltransferase
MEDGMFARIASASSELDRCLEIRRAVFIDEQGVDEALELDGLEDTCMHFVAWKDEPYEIDRAIGTARLLLDQDRNAKAQRVAVQKAARRCGIGRLLMRELEAEAQRQGAHCVLLGAQLTAMAFYQKIGYEAYGAEFDDAGIPHKMMRLRLR